MAVVLARADDTSARRVTDRFAKLDLPTATGLWTHTAFLDAAGHQPALADWAGKDADPLSARGQEGSAMMWPDIGSSPLGGPEGCPFVPVVAGVSVKPVLGVDLELAVNVRPQ